VASLAPFRHVGPLIALGAGSVALGAAPDVPWAAAVAAAGLFLAAAAVQRVQAAGQRRSARRVADVRILRGGGVPPWREQELCSPRALASRRREIERLVRSASAARMASASPVDRGAVRRDQALFEHLAARLADDRPVSPRGVLHLDQLLRDPDSPLYGGNGALLPRALTRVLGALEP
jgi:hypothetical protein